jgi:hypothetical protein
VGNIGMDQREGVGALCERRVMESQSIWCAGLSCLSRSSNQANRKDQMDKIPPRAGEWDLYFPHGPHTSTLMPNPTAVARGIFFFCRCRP